MSEVEKMYRNAHVYPMVSLDITKENFENRALNMVDRCNEAFTAKKQLELVKWLSINYLIEFKKIDSTQEYYIGVVTDNNKREWWASVNFENALAAIINNLWQDLTEEEHKQIKEILE